MVNKLSLLLQNFTPKTTLSIHVGTVFSLILFVRKTSNIAVVINLETC
ncbi:MAG: DUF543 domain-containing protein [Kosmotoga sp.]|nr:MAG: DUF543 domain-containing protein [Kosmotoga sp.]